MLPGLFVRLPQNKLQIRLPPRSSVTNSATNSERPVMCQFRYHHGHPINRPERECQPINGAYSDDEPSTSPKRLAHNWLIEMETTITSQAVGRALGRPTGFQADIVQNFTYPNSSSQNVYTRFEHFNSFVALQILHRKSLNRKKMIF